MSMAQKRSIASVFFRQIVLPSGEWASGDQALLLAIGCLWYTIYHRLSSMDKNRCGERRGSSPAPTGRLDVCPGQWRLQSVEAKLEFCSNNQAWDSHWCMPPDEVWRRWSSVSGGG